MSTAAPPSRVAASVALRSPVITTKRLEKSIPPRSRPIIGLKISSTMEVTMDVKAAPITTPTAKSITLPRMMKALNSFSHCGSFTGMCPVILLARSLMLFPQ